MQVRRLRGSWGGLGEAKTAVLCIYTPPPSSLHTLCIHTPLQLAILMCVEIPCVLHLFGVRGLCCVPTIIRGASLHTNAAWGGGAWGRFWGGGTGDEGKEGKEIAKRKY